jgi:hypothetical protein
VIATAPIELIRRELEAYRRGGPPLHLVHARRALNEPVAAMRNVAPPELWDVGAADEGR